MKKAKKRIAPADDTGQSRSIRIDAVLVLICVSEPGGRLCGEAARFTHNDPHEAIRMARDDGWRSARGRPGARRAAAAGRPSATGVEPMTFTPGDRVIVASQTWCGDKNRVARLLLAGTPLTVCEPPAGRGPVAGRVWCETAGRTPPLFLRVPAEHLSRRDHDGRPVGAARVGEAEDAGGQAG